MLGHVGLRAEVDKVDDQSVLVGLPHHAVVDRDSIHTWSAMMPERAAANKFVQGAAPFDSPGLLGVTDSSIVDAIYGPVDLGRTECYYPASSPRQCPVHW